MLFRSLEGLTLDVQRGRGGAERRLPVRFPRSGPGAALGDGGEEPEGESIVEGGGEIELDEAFARDSVYGTREFLTPVSELVIDTVTAAERRGYDRWRGAFERSWGGAFDPIASRFDVREDGLRVDMTLVPLIVNSDYGFLLDLVGRERLSATSVTPHAESLVHFVAALDRDGPLFEQVAPALPVAGLGDDGPVRGH